ncbi:reverse transcriptase domain-containing protein [Tanacetum coccineum]
MQTRSSSKFVSKPSTNPTSTIPKRRNRRHSIQRVEPFSLEETPVDTMVDQRTMEQLFQAPTEGYGDAILIPAILAKNFELKHGLLNLVTSKPFYGFEKEDPHAHIRWYSKITSAIKYRDVPNTSIKLMLFPFSIEGAARIWLEKEPPHSILTWEDLVSKFINQLFPPSKTTNLQYEITNFQQKFKETFSEAWDRFKDLLRTCPHHGFTELYQLDTFYNALNSTDQDSFNATAVGNLLTKTPRDALTIIENKSKVRNSRNKPVVSRVSTNAPSSSTPHSPQIVALVDAVKVMLHLKSSPPASVKAVEEICVTCGGPHPYHQCLATDGNVFPKFQDYIQRYVSAAAVNYNQGNTSYRPQSIANQIRPSGFAQPNVKNNHQGYNQNRGTNQVNQSYQALIQQPQVAPSNELSNYKRIIDTNMKAISFSSNTIANPKGELKAITTQSGIVLDEPSVPMPLSFINPEEDERAEETSTDPELAEYTIKVPPPLVQKPQAPSQKSYEMPKRDPLHPNIPYPSRMYKEKQQDKVEIQIHKFWQMFKQLHINITLAEALILIPKYQKMLKALFSNKEKLLELANTPLNENCSAVILKKLPEKLGDPEKFLIPCSFSELNWQSLEHPSDTNVFTMKMEILLEPASNKLLVDSQSQQYHGSCQKDDHRSWTRKIFSQAFTFIYEHDTKANGEYLRKCIFDGPYKLTSVVIEAVAATVNAPAVPEHDEAETVHNMSEENKLYFKAEKEAIFFLLTGIGDEIYSTVDACNTANEMWTAIERLQQGESLNIQDVKTNLF